MSRSIPPLLVALMFAATALPAAAASQSDEDACRPDVFRLCSADIPNETAIVACLDARLTQLSPACYAVMAPPKPVHRRRPAHS